MKWLISVAVVLCLVTPAIAGQDPYVAIVGNDVSANDFYNSPKYQQFTYDQLLFGVPVCAGSFPAAYNPPYHPSYGLGCEQFRSQFPVINPEVCDSEGEFIPPNTFRDRGNDTAAVSAGNAGWYEWYVRLPKKPAGQINLVLQCGVLKPNTFASEAYDAVRLCAAETGEKVGAGFCTRKRTNAGANPLVVGGLPKITAIAYPGPYNSFAPFHLTAFRNPGTYNPFSSGVLVNNAAGQLLNGTDNGTRILLKACMDKTIVTKLPIEGQVNAAAETEADLVAGDIIYVRMAVTTANTVDIYCHEQSLKVMGVGEAPFPILPTGNED